MCPCPKPFLLPILAIAIWLMLSDPITAQVDAEARAADVREQLAEAELSARLSADMREGLMPFMELVNELACGPAFDGRDELLELVTLSMVDLLADGGDLGLALGMLTPEQHRQAEDSLMTPEGMAVWAEVMQGPRLAARRAELVERQREASRRGAAGVEADGAIASTVATLLETSAHRDLLELGPRAVPALLEQRRPERAPPIPSFYQDPYWYLARIDPDMLATTLLDDLRSGRLADLDRAVRALMEVTSAHRRSLWLSVAGRAPRLTSDPLLEILSLLLAEPRLITQTHQTSLLAVLDEFVVRDALIPEHAELLGQAAGTMPSAQALQLLGTLVVRTDVATPSVRAALEPLLEHPDDLVRRRAAGGLVMLDDRSALLERAADPDPVVRAEVARWFTRFPRTRRSFSDDGGVGWQGGDMHIPRPRAEDLSVLAALCDDPVSSVRRVAAQGAVDARQPLPASVYRGLAGDPDPRVRMVACGLTVSDPDLQAELLLGLAEDPDPAVRTALFDRDDLTPELRGRVLSVLATDPDPGVRLLAARSLQKRPSTTVGRDVALGLARHADPQVRLLAAATGWADVGMGLDVLAELADDPDADVRAACDLGLIQMLDSGAWLVQPERFLEVVAMRRRFPTDVEEWASGDQRGFQQLFRRREGVEALTRWAIEDGGQAAWDDLVFELPVETGNHNSTPLQVVRDGWLGLDDDSLEVVLRRLAPTRPWMFWFVAKGLDPLPPEREAMARRLFETRDGSVGLGLLGGRALAVRAGEDDLAALTVFVGEVDREGRGAFVGRDAGQSFDWMLASLVNAVQDDAVNGWLMSLVEDDDLSPAWRQRLAAFMRKDAPGTVTLAEAVIARWWGPSADDPPCADAAVGALLDVGADGLSSERLAELTVSPRYGARALHLLSARRDDVGFAYLADMIARPDDLARTWTGVTYISTEERLQVVVTRLVDGLVAHLSDDAAQVLLDAAARTSSSSIRQQLMGGVTRIQEFQDAQAAWERRLSNRATRDTAVAEVLALLDDEDPMVRAAAAKSLATLRAVEHLPRLIRMLRDPDERVVEVAGRAIDELHDAAGEAGDR